MPPLRSTALRGTWLAVFTALLVAGCASPKHKAPVEERSATTRPAKPATPATAPGSASEAAPAAADAAKPPPPGAENAGKPGYYTVKPGDTLIRIGLDNGQNWRDVVRWNAIENPNLIEVGQVLRVVPPGQDAGVVVARAAAAAPASAASGAAAASAPSAPVAAREGDDDLVWAWPAAGAVAGGFEEGKSRGLVITGKAGDPVLAAADGRVIYVGSQLRGYGNLVIVKHNATYLTAYAHNQTLLVKDDQAVRRGQKIAEMGASDAERVQLHFEIRRQGKPVDPTKLLPPR
ncbi:MAG: peptidase [Burkholderiales bacterium PBB5]|nr:MAG: peptidase [Burkholderiales bacterium PBB5]